VLCAGCGDRAPAPVGTATPTAGAAASRSVHFRASDGHHLHGTYTPAERRPAPGVVLVHGLYGEPSQWNDFVGELHRAGFATLAYASRSDHEPDEGVLVRDVVGAVRALRGQPGVDAGRIGLTGSSVGGSTVAYALATRPGLAVRGGVAVSALEGPREAALGKRHAFRPHGLLLIADQREAQSSRDLLADAHGVGVTTYFTESVGHGTELLAQSGVRDRAIAWLEHVSIVR
jgi:dienelactone hydrolase